MLTGARTSVMILLLAAILRLLWLDLRPAHFDEGVNGWFVDGMTRDGFYHYDPTNFHGPLHFYSLFLSQTLLGRNLWALRLPTALVGIGCVALVLGLGRYFDRRACRWAALGVAVSPGMVFYGRDAIHETWLVFFLLLTLWGIAGLWKSGERVSLWAVAAGVTGMVLTKETYLIHVAAFLLAIPTLQLVERFSASAPLPWPRQLWNEVDLRRTWMISAAVIIFFYSGALLDWPAPQPANPDGTYPPMGSVAGLVETFSAWIATGTRGATGHEKGWYYWLELLCPEFIGPAASLFGAPSYLLHRATYEFPALLGLLAAPWLLRPGSNRLSRYLAIYGAGVLAAYSLVPYKTPWCLISMMWPFHLIFGLAVVEARRLDRVLVSTAAVTICALSLAGSWALNFRNFTNEDEPYVYVQTLLDVNKLLDPLQRLVAGDRTNYHLIGYVLSNDHHPLPWLLGDFTRINLMDAETVPDLADAEFVLADDTIEEEVEAQLAGAFFKDRLRIRGHAAETSVLYMRADVFGVCFPGRRPEFHGRSDAPSDDSAPLSDFGASVK